MDTLNAMTKQLAAVWKRISLNQRISIVLVAIVAFIGLWLFASLSHRPSMALLYPETLDQTDAAEIVEKLRDENVSFEVRDGGRRIYVPSHLVNTLRLTMAGSGLPATTGGTGWGDVFDKGGLGGQSATMININKLRALQGELARTISSLANVQTARVHLVMPEKRLFKQDQEPVTASVVLGLRPGTELGTSEISGIRYLCASAIEGLTTHNITILDGSGQMLARPRETDSMLNEGSEQLVLARRQEEWLTEKISRQLDMALGPNNSVVVVTVDLDNQSLQTEEKKTTEGATRRELITESTSGSTKRRARGEAGADSNVLDLNADAGGSGGSSTETNTVIETESEPNVKVTKLTVPAGSIKHVSASVIVNKDRKPTGTAGATLSVTQVEELVTTIINPDPTRTVQVSVHESSFLPVHTVDQVVAKVSNPVIGAMAKHGPAAIISLALLGFLWVAMKKVKYTDHTPGLRTMPIAAAAGAASSGRDTRRGLPSAVSSNKKVQEIFNEIVLEDGEAELRGLREAMGQLAEEKPESVAAVIRQWLS